MNLDKNKVTITMARACIGRTELARKSGVSCATVSGVLAGKNVKPETAGRIAAALGVDVTEIMESGS